MGMTLRRARSLKNHWMMKRNEKRPWPRKPITSQRVVDSLMSSLPAFDDGAQGPPQQPEDADEVQEGYGEAVADAVFRAAVPARPVLDRDFDHRAARAREQRGQIAVHVVEGGQLEEGLAAEQLEAATRIAHAVAQDAAPERVGEARGQALVPAGAPHRAVARDQQRGRRGGPGPRGDEPEDLRRRILPVAVKGRDPLRSRGAHPREQRSALAEASRVAQHAQPGVGETGDLERLAGAVAA